MVNSANNYIFTLDKLIKSWRKGKAPPSVEFAAYPTDPKICVVTTLDFYLHLSKKWRDKGQSQLLLSSVKPHNEVQKSTVSGWIKTTLGDAGIDTNQFKAHSTRAASTSKASVCGLSLQDILNRGKWSSDSTWQKHYHKFVISKAKQYQDTIMNDALN